MAELRFAGSTWCNIDIALRSVHEVYRKETEPLGLTVIEWYILQTLYEGDGQQAGQIAQAVGRAPTSFTPILDQLEKKRLIERRPHPADRRAIRIYVTAEGKAIQEQVIASVERIDTKLRRLFSDQEWQSYLTVISRLQQLAPEIL